VAGPTTIQQGASNKTGTTDSLKDQTPTNDCQGIFHQSSITIE